ncbi:oxidoreductase [Coprinopsis cinerea okayama7|uniref:Electron transfer flavoprotein-ubiquinone oxidoreductase n=1 Tax=Coprinopsis cinerea (strain Okayama-7 / 130 / ATCC MYA-4618 / FGSC 9003) TaxID=240176 RepID=A8PH18_COPC7|nr:oxidoreductase [Coprinopsis cinerea okayama7\|eukprot:XP_001841322.2 oxidoreductase [Coprinopsis cinerea okayama7\
MLRSRVVHINSRQLLKRCLSSTPRRANEPFTAKGLERAEDEVDVCIVGGGPAGLSAAIRLKQLEREKGNEIRVVVLEKGSEIGSHILSGAVIEPRALNELLPEWSTMEGHPLTQPATSSKMLFMTENRALPIPHPPQMGNKGNYIISLSQFTRWLAGIAENEYGVEIYPGFAGSQLLYSEEPDSYDHWGNKVHSVRGVVTNEVGLTKDFRMKSSFEPGMAFRSKVTLLSEGAHGSLSKQAISKYDLRREAQPQTYGIGLKEVWRVDPSKHEPGKVRHMVGWPMDYQTYGGAWEYHADGGLVTLGLVIGLDYKNPYLSPYRELQRMKHHPYWRSLLEGGERLAYGARVLNEGGLQSIPKLSFPGGALLGCSAGVVNIAKIKGTHNAMKTGMLAAESAFEAVQQEDADSKPSDMSSYDKAFNDSWVYKDLHEVRNMRPAFNTRLGLWGGIAWGGLDSLIFKGRVPFTFKHDNSGHAKNENNTSSLDSSHTEPASKHKPIDYPPFQPPLSTDLMTSVALTGTNHAEDQPVHLRVVKTRKFVEELAENENLAVGAGVNAVKSGVEAEAFSAEEVAEERETRVNHVKVNVGEYAGLLGRACPAGVYEYVDVEGESDEGTWQGLT